MQSEFRINKESRRDNVNTYWTSFNFTDYLEHLKLTLSFSSVFIYISIDCENKKENEDEFKGLLALKPRNYH